MNSVVEIGFDVLTVGLGCLNKFGKYRLYRAIVAPAHVWVSFTHESDSFMATVSSY